MSIAHKVETLQGLVDGTVTVAEAAAKLNLSEAEISQWREVYALTCEVAARNERARTRRVTRTVGRIGMSLAAMVAVVVGVWTIAPAWAQVACTQTLPAPLKTFCPNAPALATEVNGNFSTVATWLTTKTGTLGSADLTTQDITARNATLSGAVSFGAATRQMLNLYAPNYGIGVQNSTLYARTGGGFSWFQNGTHVDAVSNDPGAGGTRQMNLDAAGNLFVRGELAAATLRQSNCAWGTPGPATNADNQFHEIFCPAGKYMFGWRCYADASLNGNCSAYCCTP